jgi:hypothetical protein
MAYRSDERAEPLEAAATTGKLSLEIGATHVRLGLPTRTLVFAEQYVTLTEHKKRDRRSSWRLDGRVVVARDVPRDDLGIWVEDSEGMLRIFDAAPTSLLDDGGLSALRAFDRLAHRLRGALRPYAAQVNSAVEIGRGLDKVLLVDVDAHVDLYARPLFRERAKLILRAGRDGDVMVAGAKGPVRCSSKYGVTVHGDYIRFFDRHGSDLARVAVPWVEPEDRREIARRIGECVDQLSPTVSSTA